MRQCTSCGSYRGTPSELLATAIFSGENCATLSPQFLSVNVIMATGIDVVPTITYTIEFFNTYVIQFLYKATQFDPNFFKFVGTIVRMPPIDGYQFNIISKESDEVVGLLNVVFNVIHNNVIDTYNINVHSSCNGSNGITVIATRNFQTEFSSSINNQSVRNSCTRCNCFIVDSCSNIRVPRINILGQRTVDNAYISDVQFTICDEFTYYNERSLSSGSKCSINFISTDQLKETFFKECNIPLEIVVRGKGTTLFEKAVYLYNKYATSIGPSFYNFYDNLILYGLSKYILARVLYGNFNLKYLLQKYNEKFLANLGHSRFCGFLEAFDNCQSQIYNYNRFFK